MKRGAKQGGGSKEWGVASRGLQPPCLVLACDSSARVPRPRPALSQGLGVPYVPAVAVCTAVCTAVCPRAWAYRVCLQSLSGFGARALKRRVGDVYAQVGAAGRVGGNGTA